MATIGPLVSRIGRWEAAAEGMVQNPAVQKLRPSLSRRKTYPRQTISSARPWKAERPIRIHGQVRTRVNCSPVTGTATGTDQQHEAGRHRRQGQRAPGRPTEAKEPYSVVKRSAEDQDLRGDHRSSNPDEDGDPPRTGGIELAESRQHPRSRRSRAETEASTCCRGPQRARRVSWTTWVVSQAAKTEASSGTMAVQPSNENGANPAPSKTTVILRRVVGSQTATSLAPVHSGSLVPAMIWISPPGPPRTPPTRPSPVVTLRRVAGLIGSPIGRSAAGSADRRGLDSRHGR